jgi:hypothetical protein
MSSQTFAAALLNGQCYLSYVSATALKLIPQGGNNIQCTGVSYQIASAGVSAANTSVQIAAVGTGVLSSGSLAASTAYYVAFQILSGTQTLTFYPAASFSHAPDTTVGNTGIEVITNGGTPITGATLTGLINTNASSQFFNMGVASWFNPQPKYTSAVLGSATALNSATWVEISTALRIPFVTFGNRAPTIEHDGSYSTGNITESVHLGLGIDGSASANLVRVSGNTAAAQQECSANISAKAILTEGSHYATLSGESASAYQVNFAVFNITAGTYPIGNRLQVTIDG